jgi:hypothetical protein
VEVYNPTAAEKQKFGEAAQPAVIKYLSEKLGADLVDNFVREVKLAETRAGWRR